jgi:glutamate dehydrogenase (NADP+)
MLEAKGDSLAGKKCIVTGSGNVAQFAIEKILQNGGVPVTASDSSGFIYDPDGIDMEKLDYIMDLKEVRRGRIHEYAEKYPGATFTPRDNNVATNPIWEVKADLALPCATQNELIKEDAENLVKNGCMLVAEGANMPCTPDAIEVFQKAGVMYAPGKASNAGGVATSGLEMVQNFGGMYWTSEEVDQKLQGIMKNIHDICINTAKKYGHEGDYMAGANIAGFIKVADAMIAEGVL